MARALLVLGGYSPSLIVEHDVNFEMPPEGKGRDLEVFVKRISIKSNESDLIVVSNNTFTALIDSATTHYYLPPEICKTFAQTFNLRYNSTLALYLVNGTEHDRLQRLNPEILITLSNKDEGGQDITFSLPYPSLELRLTNAYPSMANWTRYVPLRPASTSSQPVLGRAFLQEVYLIANYEARNFSLGKRNFSSSITNDT